MAECGSEGVRFQTIVYHYIPSLWVSQNMPDKSLGNPCPTVVDMVDVFQTLLECGFFYENIPHVH